MPLVIETYSHCRALQSHANPGHGHCPPSHVERGPGLGFTPSRELCCSAALMAGMFGDSNRNNWASVALPFIRNGMIYVLGRFSCRLSSKWLYGATWPSGQRCGPLPLAQGGSGLDWIREGMQTG